MILQKDDKSGWNAWQAFLVMQGNTDLVCDGIPGPATDRATRAFQSASGLTADGIVGDGTLAAAKAKGFGGLDCGQTDTPLITITQKVVVTPSAAHVAVFDGDRNSAINAAFLAHCCPKIQTRVPLFIAAAGADGVPLRIVQGFRTFPEQHSLFLEKDPPVTHADAGQSNHNYGLAVDLCVLDSSGQPDWESRYFNSFGKWAATAGLVWGGSWKSFKDMPHIEVPGLPHWPQLLTIYKQGGIAEVWKQFG